MPARMEFAAGNPASAARVAARISPRLVASKICLRRKNVGKGAFTEAASYPAAAPAATPAPGIFRQCNRLRACFENRFALWETRLRGSNILQSALFLDEEVSLVTSAPTILEHALGTASASPLPARFSQKC